MRNSESSPGKGELGLYDRAMHALAEAVRIDEVKGILDAAAAMRAYAKQAKNRKAEENAVALRMRATRCLAKLIKAQKDGVGLAKGGKPYQRKLTGASDAPVATLAMQGIDKHLAKQARVLGALSDEAFEDVVADARDKVSRAVRNAVREVEIAQEHEAYASRVKEGCTVADLEALAASGRKFGVIYVDVPSRFYVYSGKGKQRSGDRYYDTMDVAALAAMAPTIQALAAKDCALFFCTSGPHHENAYEIIKAWGFGRSTYGCVWIKTNRNAIVFDLEDLQPSDLKMGTGYTTRANAEIVLLAKRGKPKRLNAGVCETVLAPVTKHSEKPEEVRRRIERLYPGPYLELFARKKRDGWTIWGNEIERETWGAKPAPAQPSATADEADGIPAFLNRRAAL
jgi:N6-adenosine-specific RNA methylase IME4